MTSKESFDVVGIAYARAQIPVSDAQDHNTFICKILTLTPRYLSAPGTDLAYWGSSDNMKKTLLALFLSRLFAAHAGASTYWDINLDAVTLNASKPSYTNWFDITGPFGLGYDPATEYVYSAYAEFQLFDADFGPESLTINLGGSPLVSQGSFFALIPISVGNGILGSALLDLSTDGKVSYTLNRTAGDFTLVSSIIEVKAGAQVPDGGATLTLLGLALLGILGLQRKFASVG